MEGIVPVVALLGITWVAIWLASRFLHLVNTVDRIAETLDRMADAQQAWRDSDHV